MNSHEARLAQMRKLLDAEQAFSQLCDESVVWLEEINVYIFIDILAAALFLGGSILGGWQLHHHPSEKSLWLMPAISALTGFGMSLHVWRLKRLRARIRNRNFD